MKKVFALVLALCMALSCSAVLAEDKPIVAIIQLVDHSALNDARDGFIRALTDNGFVDGENFVLDYQNGQGDQSNLSTIADQFVAEKAALVLAIATPAAVTMAGKTTEIPILGTAITDYVSARLVESNEKPGYPCTGTSDVLDLDAQVELIQAFQPDVKSIGILYTSSEDNSVSNLKTFKEICKAKNIEVVASAVQNASDIPTAAEDLASKVDCINNFTDNNVVNNLSVVLSAADKYNIPVYGSEEEQVKNGCLASVSIDYVALGKVTGEMAVEALNGADTSSMAVKTISDATPIINSTVLKKLGYTVPDSFTDVTTVD